MYKTIVKIDNIVYKNMSIDTNIKKLISYNSIIISQNITKYLFKNNINIDSIYSKNELYHTIAKQIDDICANQIKIFKDSLYNTIVDKDYIRILATNCIENLINNLRIKKDDFFNINVKNKEFNFDFAYKIYSKTIENIIKDSYNKDKNKTYFIDVNNFNCDFNLQLKNNINYAINLSDLFIKLIELIQKYSELTVKVEQI